MKRLGLVVLLLLALALPLGANRGGAGSARFHLVEATIADVQKAVQTGLVSTEELVRMYLTRIAAYDQAGPRLNSYIHVNADALEAARNLDALRHPGIARLPLDGVPVMLKDNVDTADMPTTAGSVALNHSIPPDDAFIARRLRQAGAVILGKGTLTEYANFLTAGMPTGYSSLGGFGFNPYDPRVDPRTVAPFNDGRPALATGGSSSGPGIAVAANLAMVSVGTETSGSILSPGTQNLVVGIKPTVGLVSRDGIIPITADQDTAGPMARTVTDAAVMLGVLAGYDPRDPATAPCMTPGHCFSDYTRFLDKHALRGARIAVPRVPYWTGLSASQQAVMENAIAALRAQGAYVADPYEIPNQTEISAFGICVTYPAPANCSTVLLYGFKRDLNAYLASLGPTAPVQSLTEVVAFNAAYTPPMKYGQTIAVAADMLDTSPGSADTVRYLADRARDLDLTRTGLDAVYNGPDAVPGTADDFDAILFPANRGANAPARAGYPSIVVPGGFVENAPTPPFPADFMALPAPYGVTFSGPAFSEPRLIALAYAFEQATRHRVPPPSTPPLPGDVVTRPH